MDEIKELQLDLEKGGKASITIYENKKEFFDTLRQNNESNEDWEYFYNNGSGPMNHLSNEDVIVECSNGNGEPTYFPSNDLVGIYEYFDMKITNDLEKKMEMFNKDILFIKGNEHLIGDYLKTNRPEMFKELLEEELKEHDLSIDSIKLEEKKVYVYPLVDDNKLKDLLESYYEDKTFEEVVNNADIVKVIGESLNSNDFIVKLDVSKEEILEKFPSIEYLVGRIEKGGFTEPHSIKATLIENYQYDLEEMGSYVLSDDFPSGVNLFSDGIEWDITYVKIKNIQLLATDAIEYIEDRELTTTEFLSDYLMDMLMEDYDKYLIINIDVYTDPQDWAEKNRELGD